MGMVSWLMAHRSAASRAALVAARLGVGLVLASCWLAPAPLRAQPTAQGLTFLRASQQADGGWSSSQVRRSQATAEALRAFQELAPGDVTVKSAAANYLSALVPTDNEERARALPALAAEGRNVAALAASLATAGDAVGGWGLTSLYAHDPLDTALSLDALLGRPEADDDLVRSALLRLIVAQQTDGGFPCLNGSAAEPASELYCTAPALGALLPYRTRFLLDPEINAAIAYLRGQRNADGSFGPAGAERLVRSALAARALALVPAFGAEVVTVTAFLVGQQQPDGSWEGDPYVTAAVLRALKALAGVPFCGDGLVNVTGEVCDGSVPAAFTCEGLGLGPGTLACSSGCTLDTSGCSAPPICGDNLRNQPFEICDGTDVAGETCQSQGFTTGTLGCAADCLNFDVSTCVAAPSCGDGVINQPSESCDLSDLGGLSCEALGLGSGLLACAADCNLDTRQCDSAGFDVDNKGREFFLGFLPNPLGAATASVNLTSDVATSATVQYPAVSPSFSQTVALTPGQVTVVNVPAGAHANWTAGRVLNNAVRVAGAEEFVAYVVNRAPFTSDAGMALPIDALGTSYLVTTARGSAIVGQDRSQFLVLAAFDGTTVTVTPTATVRIPAPGTNAPPGVPFQVTLNRGEGFRAEALNSGADLSGTLIEADRPLAMVNGNLCTNVPTTTAFCDHIFEVGHPLRSWGTRVLVTNLPNRAGGSVYRVMASESATVVSLDGVPQATLNRGQFFELGPIAGSHLFEGTAPIWVTQFMTGSTSPGANAGDPAMANMIPPDQFLERYTFSTVGGGQFNRHFLSLIAPSSAVGTLLLDGTPVAAGSFTPIGSTGFSAAVVPLAEGSHTTSSTVPHGITVEGLNQDDSYIYPGGARVAFINQFCGDGAVNRAPEECDGSDFQAQTCGSFGFSGGQLRCTTDCRIDISGCTGLGAEDRDGDGFPSIDDCDDLDPEVNPGRVEIPGNGKDDDCNPGTPDEVPTAAAACRILTGQLAYLVSEPIRLAGEVENASDSVSLAGLTAALEVTNAGGAVVAMETRTLAALPPGARARQSFVLSAVGYAAGAYQAQLQVLAGTSTLTTCSVGFTVDGSAATGAGLGGELTLTPSVVDAGDSTSALYAVENVGNEALDALGLRIVLVDPETGGQLAVLTDSTSLAPAARFETSQLLSTTGLLPKVYLVVLIAVLPGSGAELTLDSELLTVVNAPPVCTGATATPARLWPPNHGFVEIALGGVTDPDGDPLLLTVTSVRQDEPTNATGDGNFCPDAQGLGTPRARVRAERRGSGDGRVYHLSFTASDGRGGTCTGTAKVCVPKSQGGNGANCVDQGPLFDSTVCP
jgi:hypothetical protein